MYIIYTDGGCTKGRGSWSAIINDSEISGTVPFTTSNRMELYAAIKAFGTLPNDAEVQLFSDSTYLVKGLNSWIACWKKRGWKKKGSQLKNLDLWQELDIQKSRLKIKAKWVPRGQNSKADRLAGEARVKFWGI